MYSNIIFFCVGVVYSGEYDVCDVTLSVYPHHVCDVTLSVYPHVIGVTSQTSYSPEYTTPTQKKSYY